MFSEEKILETIKEDILKPNILIYDEVTSTNDLAAEFAEKGAREGTIILAREQSCGRGRSGKSFFSPKDGGIYMSIVLRPKVEVEHLSYLTPLFALAVAKSIESVTKKQAKIKWVNDVFIDEKKVCGILTESKIAAGEKNARYVIVGIGINLAPTEEKVPEEIEKIVGFLSEKEEETIANRLIGEIWNHFLDEYDDLTKRNFLKEYVNRSLLPGREIAVVKHNTVREGMALEIDGDFRLKVRYKDGEEEWLNSGDVSIKM